MFKNFLAKLGKGGSKVDLVLDREEAALGEEIKGELVIQGGTVEQRINRIDIQLFLSIHKDGHDYTRVIEQFPFDASFTIQPSEKKTFPFTYILPNNLLLSTSNVHYYFVTHLDIAGAVDHTDRDYIVVKPSARLQNVLDAFGQLGFVEKHGSRSFNGYVQEFAFAPTSFLKDQVEEVEFAAAIEESGIRLYLEVDLYSFLGEKEIRREVWLDHALLDNRDELKNHLEQILHEIIANPQSFVFHSGSHHKYHGLAGAMGGVALGLIAAELIDEVGDLLEGDDEENSGDEGLFDDFFGGDDD